LLPRGSVVTLESTTCWDRRLLYLVTHITTQPPHRIKKGAAKTCLFVDPCFAHAATCSSSSRPPQFRPSNMVRVPAPRPPTPNKLFESTDDIPRHPLANYNQKFAANDKRAPTSTPAPASDRENVALSPDMIEQGEDSDTGTIRLGPSRARPTQTKPRELKRALSRRGGDLSPSVGSPNHPSVGLSPVHVLGKFGESDMDIDLEEAPAQTKPMRATEILRQPVTPHRPVPPAPPAVPHGYVSVNCQKYFTGGRAGHYPQRSAPTGHIEAWDSS